MPAVGAVTSSGGSREPEKMTMERLLCRVRDGAQDRSRLQAAVFVERRAAVDGERSADADSTSWRWVNQVQVRVVDSEPPGYPSAAR